MSPSVQLLFGCFVGLLNCTPNSIICLPLALFLCFRELSCADSLPKCLQGQRLSSDQAGSQELKPKFRMWVPRTQLLPENPWRAERRVLSLGRGHSLPGSVLNRSWSQEPECLFKSRYSNVGHKHFNLAS